MRMLKSPHAECCRSPTCEMILQEDHFGAFDNRKVDPLGNKIPFVQEGEVRQRGGRVVLLNGVDIA